MFDDIKNDKEDSISISNKCMYAVCDNKYIGQNKSEL